RRVRRRYELEVEFEHAPMTLTAVPVTSGVASSSPEPSERSGASISWTNLTSASRRRRIRRAIDSIAILPLINDSADPNAEYLSDGITESIINTLSRLPKLRVMARSTVFRYKGKEVDPQQVGFDLGIRAVVMGRLRLHHDDLLIQAKLIDVADGSQLWGERYKAKF